MRTEVASLLELELTSFYCITIPAAAAVFQMEAKNENARAPMPVRTLKSRPLQAAY